MTSPFRSDDGAFTIARAVPADAAELACAAAMLFAQAFGEDNTPENMAAYVAESFTETRQRHEIDDPQSRIWLARAEGGALVGYAHLRFGSWPPASETKTPAAEIARLYTDRNWHGRGLGAALMKACIAVAREARVDVLWLGVWERNLRARTFYQKHGLRVFGEQSFMLGSDRQRDLVMAMILT
jgi:diamine N-acetyltransferase